MPSQIWEHSTWLCAATLRHHRESVWDVRVHGGKVVTCGVDGNVAVVSLNREQEFPVLMMVTEKRSESVISKNKLRSCHVRFRPGRTWRPRWT